MHRTLVLASALFSLVQAAPHRDCGRVAYHTLLQSYVASLKAQIHPQQRASLGHAVDDCLLSSIFATRWVDVLFPRSLEQLPELPSFPSLYESFAASASPIEADVVTAAFLGSREGGSSIASALSELKKAIGLGIQNTSPPSSSSSNRRVVLVPFSALHNLKWNVFASNDSHVDSRSRGGAISVISTVGLMLRQQHEVWNLQKIRPPNVLELCVVPPSVEFSLIIASASKSSDVCGDDPSQWSPERLAGDVDVRTAYFSKALGCRGVIGLPANKNEKNKFLSLGVPHGRWPNGDDTVGVHKQAQQECSRLAHRFEQREQNIRKSVRR